MYWWVKRAMSSWRYPIPCARPDVSWCCYRLEVLLTDRVSVGSESADAQRTKDRLTIVVVLPSAWPEHTNMPLTYSRSSVYSKLSHSASVNR